MRTVVPARRARAAGLLVLAAHRGARPWRGAAAAPGDAGRSTAGAPEPGRRGAAAGVAAAGGVPDGGLPPAVCSTRTASGTTTTRTAAAWRASELGRAGGRAGGGAVGAGGAGRVHRPAPDRLRRRRRTGRRSSSEVGTPDDLMLGGVVRADDPTIMLAPVTCLALDGVPPRTRRCRASSACATAAGLAARRRRSASPRWRTRRSTWTACRTRRWRTAVRCSASTTWRSRSASPPTRPRGSARSSPPPAHHAGRVPLGRVPPRRRPRPGAGDARVPLSGDGVRAHRSSAPPTRP